MTRERYLNQLTALASDVERMGQKVITTINDSVEALESRDATAAKHIVEFDSEIDAARHEIGEKAFLVLGTQQPTAIDLRVVIASINIAGELERIGDYCTGIAKLTLTLVSEPPADPNLEIRTMASITTGLLNRAMRAFLDQDVETAAEVWRADDDVDELYHRFFSLQIEDMVEHRKRVRRGTYMLWVAHNIERMADRITNIAEEIAFVVTADVASWREQLEAESVPAGR